MAFSRVLVILFGSWKQVSKSTRLAMEFNPEFDVYPFDEPISGGREITEYGLADQILEVMIG
jgi:hypothetical protein